MLDFVFCTDKNYLKGYGVLMISIMRFMPNAQMRFHVLTDDLDEADKETLKGIGSQNKACEVLFYSPANMLSEDSLKQISETLKNRNTLTKAAYYRFLIADLLPRDIHRALYLDGDIVCTDSLEELFRLDLKGAPVAMCSAELASSDIWTYNRLGYPSSEGYFTTGVMLIDLDLWRKENLAQAMFDWLDLNIKKCIFHDQDVINAVLHGRIFPLDFSYDLEPKSLFVFYWIKEEKNGYFGHKTQFLPKDKWPALCAAVEKPRLIHTTGDMKLWHRDCNSPFAPVWRYFCAQSPWKDEPLKHCLPVKRRIKKRMRHALEALHLLKAKKSEIPYPQEAFMSANAILDRLVTEDERLKV